MTPWTALLESFHSALVDELNVRLPDQKPELGLPRRSREWVLPEESVSAALAAVVVTGNAEAAVLLAFEKGDSATLGASLEQFWGALLGRAGAEFSRRGIQPKVMPPARIARGDGLPRGFPHLTRFVWIPFRVRGDCLYLGLGA